MVGAVSLNPYVSSYQYIGGYAGMRASAQNMQVQNTQAQTGQGTGNEAGTQAVSTGRSGSVSSLIGARSIAVAGQVSGAVGVSGGRGADPESPIQPVDAVSVIQPAKTGGTNYIIPFLRQGMDPAEYAVRMRIQYTDRAAEEEDQTVDSEKEDAPGIAGLHTADTEKAAEDTECQTCKERKYQDGSNDPGVSFKTPGHIDPSQSASVVRGHEMEHVVNERAKALNEGRRVISQSVTMQTGICPECGRVYTAGGVTRTTTAAETKPDEQTKDPRWILAASA